MSSGLEYRVNVRYYIGDSNGKEDYEKILEPIWEDYDIAKEALRRIKEHWGWYNYEENEKHYSFSMEKVDRPEWHKVESEVCKDHPWLLLNLPLDNGEEFQFNPPWCGYFDGLYGAKIILNVLVDPDASFEV
jgi:hypothetical protein